MCAQERERFDPTNASAPYTYRLGALVTTVAPQKSKLGKHARKHAMLLDDRPASVNVQDVVRDALARLPQGVGTKFDLQMLLHDSQVRVCGTARWLLF